MLIIIFQEALFRLYYCSNIVFSDTLKIEGIKYRIDANSKENQGFIGFFDWLRVSQHFITGIRLCLFEHQSYYKYLSKLPYISSTFGNKCYELFFEGEEYIPSISGDQDFTSNYVYESEKGNLLITFGLDHLKVEEIEGLKKHCTVINEMDLV